jgi:pSer/pThr/pTyr-binding forkhead associated (FHA) protein
VLDDRSLNGVFVNGQLIDWGKLDDGDELTVGRYHLFALEG